MQIDAYAHIVPPRFVGRVERLLADTGVPERIKLFDSWLYEDQVLTDLDARWRLLEPYPDYRQGLVLGGFPLGELGRPEVTRALARGVNDELAELAAEYPNRFLGSATSLPLNGPDAAVEE